MYVLWLSGLSYTVGEVEGAIAPPAPDQHPVTAPAPDQSPPVTAPAPEFSPEPAPPAH